MRGPEDVIDDKIWRILVEWCDAASRGDGADFRRWEDRIGDYGNAALPVVQYVGSILEYAVVERVGHAPDQEEIRELAVVLDPRYSRIVGGPSLTAEERVDRLDGTIRRVFNFSWPDSVDGIVWLLYAVAAVGAVLESPRSKLAEYRPRLSRWIEDCAPEIANWDVDDPRL